MEAQWEGSVSFLNKVSACAHANIVHFLGIFVPPGARVSSLVMERLYCSLNNLLEDHSVIQIEIKLNLLHGIGPQILTQQKSSLSFTVTCLVKTY